MATTPSLFAGVGWQFFDNNGVPLSGGLIYSYLAGSTTPVATYTTSAGTIAHSNPIVLDSSGRVPSGEIWLLNGDSAEYKFVLKTSTGTLIATYDNVPGTYSATDLANTTNPALGDALVGFRQSNSSGNLTNAVGRTVHQKLQESVSVLDFGATGDGSTDDTAAFNNAFAVATSVYIPPGTYIVSQVNVPNNGELYGAGPSSILKQKANSTQFTYVVNVASKSYVRLTNFQINGNGNAQPSGEHNHGVRISDSTNVVVDNLTVHDCNGDAIYIASTTNSLLCATVTVSNCNVYNLGRQGICIAEYGARYIEVIGNQVNVGTYVTTSTSHGNCIHFELDTIPTNPAGFSNVIGNICRDNGITFGGQFKNISVVGNVIYGGTNGGNFGLIGLVNTQDASVANNAIYGDGTTNVVGIFVESYLTADQNVDLTITGNSIKNMGGHGINIFGAMGGAPTRLNVSNNVIADVGLTRLKNGIAIETSSAYTMVSGNTISNTTNLGITVNATPSVSILNNMLYNIATSGPNPYAIFLDTNVAGTGPAIVSGNTAVWDTIPTNSVGLRVGNGAGNTRIQVFGNDFSQTDLGVVFSSAGTVPQSGSWCNITGADTPVGSFTLSAAATTVVSNANVKTASKIILVPTNAAAGTLMGSNKALYISARTQKTSFAVTTANGAAAAGTETFDYWVST